MVTVAVMKKMSDLGFRNRIKMFKDWYLIRMFRRKLARKRRTNNSSISVSMKTSSWRTSANRSSVVEVSEFIWVIDSRHFSLNSTTFIYPLSSIIGDPVDERVSFWYYLNNFCRTNKCHRSGSKFDEKKKSFEQALDIQECDAQTNPSTSSNESNSKSLQTLEETIVGSIKTKFDELKKMITKVYVLQKTSTDFNQVGPMLDIPLPLLAQILSSIDHPYSGRIETWLASPYFKEILNSYFLCFL